MRSREGIRPALTAGGASAAQSFQTSTQGAAQPGIERPRGGRMAVPEIPKPALQRTVQVRDEQREALAAGPPGLGAQRVLQLIRALPWGPSPAPFGVIIQKGVASGMRGIHKPRLGRMQLRSCPHGPVPRPVQRREGFCPDHYFFFRLPTLHKARYNALLVLPGTPRQP